MLSRSFRGVHSCLLSENHGKVTARGKRYYVAEYQARRVSAHLLGLLGFLKMGFTKRNTCQGEFREIE
jgi:hypothetical protein